MEERLAKAVATEMRDAITRGTGTKADLTEFRAETKAETTKLRSEMGELRNELKADCAPLIVWLMSTTIAVGGIIIAAVALL